LTQATISAAIGSTSVQTTLSVKVGLAGLTLSPASVFVGGSSDVTVTLSGPASENVTIAIASDNPAIAAVPPTATIQAGASSATFPITASAQGTANITATQPGLAAPQKATLSVGKPPKESKDGKEGKEGKERAKEIKDIQDAKDEDKTNRVKELRDGRINPFTRPFAVGVAPSAVESDPNAMIRQLMARVDELEQRLATGQAFIRPEERPPVGESIVNEPKPEDTPPSTGGGEPQPPESSPVAEPSVENPG
jgi:hypothetical protein